MVTESTPNNSLQTTDALDNREERAEREDERHPVWLSEAFTYVPAVAVVPIGALAIAGLMGRGPRILARSKWLSGGLALLGTAMFVKTQLDRFLLEKPSYEVEKRIGDLEIRRYAPRLVAETTVAASDWNDGLSTGFRRLAKFIFGGNEGKKRIAMTSPVQASQTNNDTSKNGNKNGERIAMTSPVTAEQSSGEVRVAFAMPRKFSANSLPKPKDDRISIREVPSERIAALSFRGTYDDERIREKKEELLSRVRDASLTPQGTPSFAGYDSPATLPLIRRVEVWVPIDDQSSRER